MTQLHSKYSCPLCTQAMAAYRTAARLFPGLHLPLIGMGMEYQRMNNLHLAEQMFWQVRRLYHQCCLQCARHCQAKAAGDATSGVPQHVRLGYFCLSSDGEDGGGFHALQPDCEAGPRSAVSLICHLQGRAAILCA